jgi:hypothetical protein
MGYDKVTTVDYEDLFAEHLFPPKKTKLQEQIEMLVTNGLGYQTKTDFLDIPPEEVFDSSIYQRIWESVDAYEVHLLELNNRINRDGRLDILIEKYKRAIVNKAELSYILENYSQE